MLILQIRGSKIWHLYDGTDVAPHEMRRQEPVATAALPSPTDVRLEAGDVLYLPRGRVHAAEATSEVSVHLTLGVHAPTLLVLVTRALDSLSYSDDRVHTQLPPRYLDDPDVRARLGGLVRDVAEALEQPSVIAEGLDSLEDDLVKRGQSPPVGQAIASAVGIDGQRPSGEVPTALFAGDRHIRRRCAALCAVGGQRRLPTTTTHCNFSRKVLSRFGFATCPGCLRRSRWNWPEP